MKALEITVNGHGHAVGGDDPRTLLAYLRDELRLYGAKNGCARGQCGACTVVVNGSAKRACLLRVARLDGAVVETVEGLTRAVPHGATLHPLQRAFLQAGAVQCGFCTPGMLMAAKALLDADPRPSRHEIRRALKPNLCRCTGYVAIVDAVEVAAAVLRGEREFEAEPEGGVGVSVVRKDAVAKVTGSPLFADDRELPGMLFGKILYAEHPHAEILGIDTSAAEAHPGVVRVATAADLPGRKTFGLLNPNQQVMAEKTVLYIGDSVAVVFAESEARAAAARDLIRVEYRRLPGIYSLEDALRPDAPLLHAGGRTVSETRVRRGDVERGFAESDVIVQADYAVPFVEHAYLEPECALAAPGEDGRLTVWSSSQGSEAFRAMIAKSLDLPEDRVRVVATPAGGGFGGREEPTVQIHCALGVHLTGRPVKITMSREESIRVSTKRHAEKLRYKLGAKRDGTLVAFEAEVLADTGAYDSLGAPVVFRSGVVTAGPYAVPHVRTECRGYYTNHPPGGAFRGFGSTQVAFAAEVQMDVLARRLGIDPFELRLRNALEEGKETITGQRLGKGVGLRKSLEAVREALAKERERLRPNPGKKLGYGIACAYKNVGIGSGKTDRTAAEIELKPDGRFLLKTAAAELGQGTETVLAQIAAEATGIPYGRFDTVTNDTGVTPGGGETTASRETYISGNAVVGAGRELAAELRGAVGRLYRLASVRFREEGVVDGETGRTIPWEELARELWRDSKGLRVRHEYSAPKTHPLPDDCLPREGDDPSRFEIHFSYCFGTHAAIVEVDEASGEVRVLKLIAAHDCGRMIHPKMFYGQVQGGALMGVGYALSEEFVLKEGRVVTDDLQKLGVPRMTQAPEIEVIPIEEEDPGGPFGAKGMGELPVNPAAPAVVNAIYDAVGVRITTLPATPAKVRAALAAKRRADGGRLP